MSESVSEIIECRAAASQLKTIIISSEDNPWYNEELRILKRQRLREYERHGKSYKYLQIRLSKVGLRPS